jgi:hypothetical protein
MGLSVIVNLDNGEALPHWGLWRHVKKLVAHFKWSLFVIILQVIFS